MIKKIICITVINLIIGFSTYAQTDFDKRIEKTYNCSDVSFSSAKLFKDFYLRGQLDSVQLLLNYWLDKCGLKEPVMRAKILLALSNGTFNDSILGNDFLYFIVNYQNRMDMEKRSDLTTYEYYKPYFGYILPGKDYDTFTKEVAEKLKNEYKEGTFEYLLCEFYSTNSDTLLYKLQDKKYADHNFYKEYYDEVNAYLKKSDFHIAWITGIWIPTNKLSVLGVHPDLGFMMGGKKRRFNYDFVLTIRFGKAKELYTVIDNNGDSVLTNHFFGGYLGLDFGYDLFARKRNEIQLIGGVAYDGFDAIKSNMENDNKGVSVGRLNLNAGLGYRYYLSNTFYLGLRAKYNFVNYTHSGELDMKGNTITLQFIIGGFVNKNKYDHLKAMKYKGLRK